MYKATISAMLALAALTFSTPSDAKLVFTTGTVVSVFVSGDGETPAQQVTFTMSFAVQTTGCTNTGNGVNQVYTFNPNDIADTQTRNNMLSVILASRASGIPLTVDYDNAGADCDANGFPIPLFVGM
jgi:uncharacterized protein YraI